MVWLTWFIAAVVFLAVGVIFSPELFGQQHPGMLTMLLKLARLLSFSAVWGTFVGGLIMFQYACTFLSPDDKQSSEAPVWQCRSKMFPVYFAMVSSCSAISVASFGYLLSWKSSSAADKHQLGFLVSALAFNLANLSVFTPTTVKMVKQRHKVERENGIGTEVGWSKNREVAKSNPQLATMNKKFFMIHGLSSLAHIMALASLAMQSRYLAGNINL